MLRTCYCIVTIVSWPWIEYKGTISQNEMQSKQKDLELEDNALIFVGGKVSDHVDRLFFICSIRFWKSSPCHVGFRWYITIDEAAKLCGGCSSWSCSQGQSIKDITLQLTANNFLCVLYTELVVGFAITIMPVTLLSYKVPSSVCTELFYFILDK